MSAYMKTIVAILTGISTWGVTAAATGGVDAVEMFGLLGVLATGLGVYGVTNAPVVDEDGQISNSGAAALALLVIAAVLFFAFFQISAR